MKFAFFVTAYEKCPQKNKRQHQQQQQTAKYIDMYLFIYSVHFCAALSRPMFFSYFFVWPLDVQITIALQSVRIMNRIGNM